MTPDVHEAVKAAIREILGNPYRYGLTWRRLPATIVDASDPTAVQIQLDGDDASSISTAVSLAGGGLTGDRVMVDVIPPSGMYIIGQSAATPYRGYRYVDTVIFTATGTTTLTPGDYSGILAVRQRLVGGGGGGGGAATTIAGQASVGAGGGGGGYSESFLTMDAIAASGDGWTVTVGAGGAGGTAGANNGATGSTTTSGGKTATGGVGGEGGAAAATTVTTQGGDGGSGTGDLVIEGGQGGNGMRNSGFVTLAGYGGASHMSGSRRASAADAGGAGIAGYLYGGGGSGGYRQVSSTQVAGGDGEKGIVIWDLFI